MKFGSHMTETPSVPLSQQVPLASNTTPHAPGPSILPCHLISDMATSMLTMRGTVVALTACMFKLPVEQSHEEA